MENINLDQPVCIFWFRRDLRLEDNHGLYKALKNKRQVLPIFIFDSNILARLKKDDARISFISKTLNTINAKLKKAFNSEISIYHGTPLDIFKKVLKAYNVKQVYTNHDYEPYATERDSEIKRFLNSREIQFSTFKDQVIFERNDIVKNDGSAYLVYTPYMRRWKDQFNRFDFKSFPSEKLLNNLVSNVEYPTTILSDLGFKKSTQNISPYKVDSKLIENYEATRNFPALNSTSKLGSHLRFGTISIRQIIQQIVKENNQTFLNELIWREFFMQILWHFPQTQHTNFKPKYNRIEWRNNENEFELWCKGLTGYPLVDAGMRELNKTGFMHNRVRMIVGSFLCKHLLIDWRWGESYFAEKLHDYEMSSNIGNWQWVAGCGVDAAPYFRIFNPTTQIQKFDKNLDYIKKWVPDFQELTYPLPIVDHKSARERCLQVYKKALL